MEALHPIKVAISGFTRQKPNQVLPRRVRVPVSVSCSMNLAADEQGPLPLAKPDWRAFRARLVATERAQTALMADPQKPTEDRWAHSIHEPEKGCLLIATEKLDGSHIYRRTVILLLSAGPDGLTGLILNRPSSFMSTKATLSDKPLFFGGPLFEGLFLVSSTQRENRGKPSGVFDEVMKGLHYGASESLDCADEMERKFGDLRFFDGYCAWEREELRDEIRAGHWTLAACSPNLIELNSKGGIELWDEVNELIGHRKVC